MSNQTRQVNIAIIGAGVTGLSTALHLQAQGMTKILILGGPKQGESFTTPGMLSGTPLDNFTRFAHAYGTLSATEVWQAHRTAYQRLLEFCQAHTIAHHRGNRYRYVVTEDEERESEKAVSALQKAGFEVTLQAPNAPDLTSMPPGPRVRAVQHEGTLGGWVDTEQLLDKMKSLCHAMLHPATSRWSIAPWRAGKPLTLLPDTQPTDEGPPATNDALEPITAEMVVLASHLDIGRQLAGFQEIVISYADQWDLWKTSAPFKPGTTISAFHGHEWGVGRPDQTFGLGGARFLRKLAGTGAASPEMSEKVSKYLQREMADTFGGKPVGSCLQSIAKLGCRPCDELPIIGPYFGNERLLMATGYMGLGLSLGYYGGQCLAELIAKGNCSQLPRLFWPERLRSL